MLDTPLPFPWAQSVLILLILHAMFRPLVVVALIVHYLANRLAEHTAVYMQGSCGYALSVPLGSVSAHSTDPVRYLSAIDCGGFHQQYLAGTGGQLPVCTKLLVPQ